MSNHGERIAPDAPGIASAVIEGVDSPWWPEIASRLPGSWL